MLRRRSRLVAKTGLARRTPLLTSKEKRTGRRDTGPDRATRELVLSRDGGCVMCGTGPYGVQIHHRKPRKSGGRAGKRESNSPANLITLCPKDHEWVESRRSEAYDAGLLVREADFPALVPIQHFLYGLVYLQDNGAVAPVTPWDAS